VLDEEQRRNDAQDAEGMKRIDKSHLVLLNFILPSPLMASHRWQ
jgi:hypothetical protein